VILGAQRTLFQKILQLGRTKLSDLLGRHIVALDQGQNVHGQHLGIGSASVMIDTRER
jgi:hypothetical protein